MVCRILSSDTFKMAPVLRRPTVKKGRTRVFYPRALRHLTRDQADGDWDDGVLYAQSRVKRWPLFGEISSKAKPIVEQILRENYTLIKRTFRQVVTHERGTQVARHMGFASIGTVIKKAWGAIPGGMEGMGKSLGMSVFGYSMGAMGNAIIRMNANLRLRFEQWVSLLLHEAIHSVVTLRKRTLGAALDHRCMIALGESPNTCFPK